MKQTHQVLDIRTSDFRNSNDEIGFKEITAENKPITFEKLMHCLNRAMCDKTVLGISLNFDEGSTLGYAQTQEILQHLKLFKKLNPNKFIVAYGLYSYVCIRVHTVLCVCVCVCVKCFVWV